MHFFGNFIKIQVAVGGWTNIWVLELIALINVSIFVAVLCYFYHYDSVVEFKIQCTFHHNHISYILNIFFIIAIL